MGGSESVILYQKDIAELFPAGEINLDMACEIIKCTPAPKANIIEDFCNMRNNMNYKYLYITFVILFILLFYFFHIKKI
jgi:hypothetical protein